MEPLGLLTVMGEIARTLFMAGFRRYINEPVSPMAEMMGEKTGRTSTVVGTLRADIDDMGNTLIITRFIWSYLVGGSLFHRSQQRGGLLPPWMVIAVALSACPSFLLLQEEEQSVIWVRAQAMVVHLGSGGGDERRPALIGGVVAALAL